MIIVPLCFYIIGLILAIKCIIYKAYPPQGFISNLIESEFQDNKQLLYCIFWPLITLEISYRGLFK